MHTILSRGKINTSNILKINMLTIFPIEFSLCKKS